MTQISGYQPPEFNDRKPFFSRKTLWVINIVLIPLIFVLSQLGQKDVDQIIESKPATSMYVLDQVEFVQSVMGNLNVHWANLENSQMLYLGFVLNRQPVSAVTLPSHVDLSTQVEGGRLWVQLQMPNNREVIYDALVFLRMWLPVLGADTPIMMAGELDEEIVTSIVSNLMENEGEFEGFYTAPNTFIQAIETPQIGSEEFEVFYVVQLLIKSRILSNRVQVSWDSKSDKRILGVNSIIQSEWLNPIDESEFDEIIQLMQKNLVNKEIPQVSIVRYLMHQAGYNLPVDYFHTRPARYQQVTIERINKQLNKLQNEIKNPK